MRYRYIGIENYKSLKHVVFEPSDLSVIVGPNAAGKSNLASAFDFIADAYQNGLEMAVARKGGYENIAFRRQRRTKAAIQFTLGFELNKREAGNVLRAFSRVTRDRDFQRYIDTAYVRHTFSIRAKGTGIRSDYTLESEQIDFDLEVAHSLFDEERRNYSFSLQRTQDKLEVVRPPTDPTMAKELEEFLHYFERFEIHKPGAGEELMIRQLLPHIARIPANTAVYQFSPKICRLPAAPSPEPRLSGYGENLPALVDWLQRKHLKLWRQIESAMRDIIPGLEEITVEYLHTKTLGLFFKEEGFSRPWTAEDVSDGTLQALAVLTAISDPRSTALIVEEPENSVHPWITKLLMSQMRRISKTRQVIVTTHSPVIIDMAYPAEVWIAHKVAGETKLERLTTLRPEVNADWEQGKYRLFEFLETGAVPEMVPVQ